MCTLQMNLIKTSGYFGKFIRETVKTLLLNKTKELKRRYFRLTFRFIQRV